VRAIGIADSMAIEAAYLSKAGDLLCWNDLIGIFLDGINVFDSAGSGWREIIW